MRRVRPVAGTATGPPVSPRVGAGRVPPILAASGRIFSQNLGSWPSVPHRSGPLPDRSRRTRAPGGSCAGVEIAVDAPPAFAVRSQVSGEWPRQSGRRSAWRGSPVALLAPLPALPPPAPRRPKLLRTARFRPIRAASEWIFSKSTGSWPLLPHPYRPLPHRSRRTPKMSGDRRFILNTNAPIHGISDTGGVGAAADLPGGDGGGSGGGAGRVRGGPVGSEVPGDRSELAAELGADHPVLRVLDADPAGDLHDERDREPEQHGAAGGADAGAFPERPSGGKADLPDAAEGGAEVEPAAVILVPGARRVRDPVRRPVPGGGGVRRVRPVAGTATGPPVSPRVGAGRVPPILAASGRIFSQNLGSWPSVPHRSGPLPDRSRRTRAPGGSCAGVEIAVDAPPAFAVRSQVSGEWPRQSGRRSAWRGSPVALLAPLPALPPPAPRRPKLLRTARFRPIRAASEWIFSKSTGSWPLLPHPYRPLPHRSRRTPKMSGDRRFILNTNAPIHGISDTGTVTGLHTEFLTLL